MNLSTKYLGFELPHPFIAGAGPLSNSVENAKKLEDAGAAGIVMHSLFKEQIDDEFSKPESSVVGLQEYLELVRKIKDSVNIPVIASLNGHSPGGWLKFARPIEEAGADALELNIYHVATIVGESATTIEQNAIEMVWEIRQSIEIPLSVKISPFYTSLANFATKLESAGTNGLVLFNRFFETDIDVEVPAICANRQLSDSRELLLRLRWLATLSGSLESTSLAVTGGVHSAVDAIKSIMCGASAIQLVSVLLKHGPQQIQKIQQGMQRWMEEKNYKSLTDMHCCMNVLQTRANYVDLLQNWDWA
jgi:dihydroorotate dehydrogenase (fumarate)